MVTVANSLFAELRRRRVFRAAGTYVAVAWVLVQIAGTLAQALALPNWALAMVIYLLALGFPIVTLLSWVFDVGPAGIVTTDEVPAARRRNPGLLAIGLVAVTLLGTFGLYLMLQHSSGAESGAAHASSEPTDSISARSIAILPFTDLSAEGDQQWFTDGLTDEVMSGLARSAELQIAARSSAQKFRDSTLDARTIGEQLGVATVLQGSVRRAGKKVRITVQLVDARTGFQVFSQSYDGRLDDILALQGDFGAQIARDLRTTLGVAEPAAARALDAALIETGE